MELNSEIIKYLDLVKELGRNAVSSFYPKDFEAYICSFELTRFNGEKEITTDFFTFPIMPNQIQEIVEPILNVKKSVSATIVLVNTTFNPTTITLNGTFGRNFKFIIGKSSVVTGPLHFNIKGFSTQIKTGYGCLKILEAMINKNMSLDENNNPYYLYFYNPALGNSYLVEVMRFEQRQDPGSNMIWNYNLTMRSLAPISQLKSSKIDYKGMLTKLTNIQFFQKGLNNLKGTLLNEINIGSTKLDELITKAFNKYLS